MELREWMVYFKIVNSEMQPTSGGNSTSNFADKEDDFSDLPVMGRSGR